MLLVLLQQEQHLLEDLLNNVPLFHPQYLRHFHAVLLAMFSCYCLLTLAVDGYPSAPFVLLRGSGLGSPNKADSSTVYI